MPRVRETAARIDRYERGLNQIAAGILRSEGRKLVRYIKRSKFRRRGEPGPDHIVSRTGRLERSLKSSVRFEADAIVLQVSMEGPQARLLEEGGVTKRRRICARRGRALAFFWDKLGKDVFFKCVNHPGGEYEARRVMERSFEERATRIIRETERQMVREWERRLD